MVLWLSIAMIIVVGLAMLKPYLSTLVKLRQPDFTGKLVIMAGLRGAGKSLWIANQGRKYIKKGKKVFSNYPIRGAYKCDIEDVMTRLFPPGSVIIYDEGHNEFDSDNWRGEEVKESLVLFSQSRKIDYTVMLASQNPIRMAKSIRDISDYFIWATALIPGRLIHYEMYYSFDDFQKKLLVKEFGFLPPKSLWQDYCSYYMHQNLDHRNFVQEIPWNVDKINEDIDKFKNRYDVEQLRNKHKEGLKNDC